LHRDLKPSNVLVTREGRLVVLDFGLVAALASDQRPRDERDLVLGTPQYMAPEQAAARAATEASDWYAVGTMLYQSLTGQLPFAGSAEYALACKRSRTSVPPVAATADAPEDLASLCDRMLAVDPSARPTDADVLEQLQARPDVHVGHPADPTGGATILHGRDHHLEALRDAYRAMVGGHSQVVFVHGQSGMGKTALVSGFLAQLRAAGGTIVLEGPRTSGTTTRPRRGRMSRWPRPAGRTPASTCAPTGSRSRPRRSTRTKATRRRCWRSSRSRSPRCVAP